jgi:hypothetical protein
MVLLCPYTRRKRGQTKAMTTTLEANVEFTAQDRCDRCGAQAKVRAKLLSGELLFCGHHAREVGLTLVMKSVSVFDPEEILNGR